MAWVENEPWEVEQGIDALKVFQLFEDIQQTIPWQFIGWDVNATISNLNGSNSQAITTQTTPNLGKVSLIIPEAVVNTLRAGGSYRYDCLLVAPGSLVADDAVLATGPLIVALRTTRRDP